MLMRAATVVQQLCKSCNTCFTFYWMFYFTCDRSLSGWYSVGVGERTIVDRRRKLMHNDPGGTYVVEPETEQRYGNDEDDDGGGIFTRTLTITLAVFVTCLCPIVGHVECARQNVPRQSFRRQYSRLVMRVLRRFDRSVFAKPAPICTAASKTGCRYSPLCN